MNRDTVSNWVFGIIGLQVGIQLLLQIPAMVAMIDTIPTLRPGDVTIGSNFVKAIPWWPMPCMMACLIEFTGRQPKNALLRILRELLVTGFTCVGTVTALYVYNPGIGMLCVTALGSIIERLDKVNRVIISLFENGEVFGVSYG